MRARILELRWPSPLPGLSDAQSAEVWDRAAAYGLVLDADSELSAAERQSIADTLALQPKLPALAAFYQAGILYCVVHPVLALVAVLLLPAAVLRLGYLVMRATFG